MSRIAQRIRWVLSAMLLVGVYNETGPWTTVTLTLVVLYAEVNSGLMRQLQEKR